MKRCLCAVLALLLVFLFAACHAAGNTAPATAGDATTPPSMAEVHREPVHITETWADNETVSDTAPTAAPDAAQVETPATGDMPVLALAGAMGLVLLCSAGLLLLRRI